MSASLDTDVNIIMRAHDRASPEVQAAVGRINGEYRKLRQEQLAIQRGFELQNQSLVAGMRTMQSAGRVANNLLNVYQNWNIAQLRISDANRRVTDSQEAWNRAMAEGDWDRAAEHAEEMERAQEDVKRATDQATFANVAYAVSIAGSVSEVVRLIPLVKTLAATMRGAAGATALSGALGGMTAGTAAGVGALGAAGIAGGAAAGVPFGIANSVAVTNIADLITGGNLTGALADQFRSMDKQFTGGAFAPVIDFFTGGKTASGGGQTNITNNYTFHGYDYDRLKAELVHDIESASVNR